MGHSRSGSGFTLIEMMVVVAVIAIFATLAAPSMAEFIDKRRVTGAAEAVYSLMQTGRSEAIKQSADVRAWVNDDTWYVGLGHDNACATTPAECVIDHGSGDLTQRVDGSNFPGVAITTNEGDPPLFTARGVPPDVAVRKAMEITFQSASGWQLRVDISEVGRVAICSPVSSTNPGAYASCN